MNILFITFGKVTSIGSRTIYCDLLREFLKNGHSVFVLSPGEFSKSIDVYNGYEATIAHINIDTARGGDNFIKKGFSTLKTGKIFINGIKHFFSDVKFDLILYSTPPITFNNTVRFIKKRDGAKSYLLLKDIFPQNAVDIGLLSKSGIRGLIYKYFKKVEKKLYQISDYIGCMSEANVQYILEHNPEIDPFKVEICPNSIEVIDKSINDEWKTIIREKYGIPKDKVVFVYGGNLGKPQGIPFLIKCLKRCSYKKEVFFLIIGEGTEYKSLEEYKDVSHQDNFKLMKHLPKEEYDTLVAACDVGLIFLDHRFTIPNFPSRLLSYMQAKIPVLAVTDINSDIGKVVSSGGFGWWCESNDSEEFIKTVSKILLEDTSEMKGKEFQYLNSHYSVSVAYETIIQKFPERKNACIGD